MKQKPEPTPVNAHKATARKLGARYVPCMVSGRYLEFPNKSAGHFGGGEFIPITVMTINEDDQHKKICELVLTREELLAALANCKEG